MSMSAFEFALVCHATTEGGILASPLQARFIVEDRSHVTHRRKWTAAALAVALALTPMPPFPAVFGVAAAQSLPDLGDSSI